jgi:4-hydroxybenzoate polyprenyltransferase
MTSISIYLSYGAGMAMNDCADAIVDSKHEAKQSRSIASKVVSIRDGWIFCFILSVASISFAWLASSMSNNAQQTIFGGFVGWTIFNLILMAGYALGMQKVFLIKNVVCSFLAISPLVGASLFDGGNIQSLGNDIRMKLYQLAAIGFPLQISREILKDIEDVEVDRNEKQTLPLVIGEANSKRVAYGLVGIVNGALLFSPYYWRMFASKQPLYAMTVVVGVPMCIIASRLSLVKGQKLLKKSIYVLLSGMISGLLLQSQY